MEFQCVGIKPRGRSPIGLITSIGTTCRDDRKRTNGIDEKNQANSSTAAIIGVNVVESVVDFNCTAANVNASGRIRMLPEPNLPEPTCRFSTAPTMETTGQTTS
ncbi:hypothetical protein DPMN_027949 [Dreissena polymorpha]|uniref:Uncharacterized protein n=1 Tax=Dreissena polymorpha TaxID=45954 RepID=A0A9D4RDX3_DREPO|nr:hypothetical protein DPMN_027949 [Dreissena polymorpha]